MPNELQYVFPRPASRRRSSRPPLAHTNQISIDDLAAVILSLTAGAHTDRELSGLAKQLNVSAELASLTPALDEAARRIALLIDTCLSLPEAAEREQLSALHTVARG